ncbi:hypothetical protein MHZ92_00770 [Sporosarcina sp. ACRSL]|uniref:hypothetical protein n=1 Tax=Sporosarcina sp. ACRSL TaxID=2918215 RepID=UPI001EF5305F|nr:hypothetical protein [Sporosarcina sp. ACRSL]MCG7342642.1 hypothetical protein [Sporosarcina sp. ACRSL]
MIEYPNGIQYVFNEEQQREVVIRMLALIKESYIFPDVAEKVYQIILSKLNNGEYAEILDPTQFALTITKDLQDSSKDKHLGLKFLEKVSGTK